ncbi:MAG TPA: hypothetical protein VM238_11425 [Phycisphaerae bacterium]|nr:hypothetical protein [Phycisphaerae bacterium]
MGTPLKRLGLRYNPFEPSASGAPVQESSWSPAKWEGELRAQLDQLAGAQGVKAIAISGEYGSGKTYILQWLQRVELPRRRIRAFYFDNPGVQFYDLANALLRQIGRKDFAKSLWELASTHVGPYQRTFFGTGFEDFLRKRRGQKPEVVLARLQDAIVKAKITTREEIAYRLAQLVADTPTKPYYEYRDFVAGRRNTLVAEREEAPYFGAILKTLRLAANIKAVAFLIDEFEEVALQKRLTRREAHEYLATLKRLINLTEEDLWLVVAMTPDAVDKTQALEPALWQRFTGQGKYLLTIRPLTAGEAMLLVEERLKAARLPGFKPGNRLFPFPDDLTSILSPANRSSPRRLVKICFYAIGNARGKTPPFKRGFLKQIEGRAYPRPRQGEA